MDVGAKLDLIMSEYAEKMEPVVNTEEAQEAEEVENITEEINGNG